jgi:hypothetical protein
VSTLELREVGEIARGFGAVRPVCFVTTPDPPGSWRKRTKSRGEQNADPLRKPDNPPCAGSSPDYNAGERVVRCHPFRPARRGRRGRGRRVRPAGLDGRTVGTVTAVASPTTRAADAIDGCCHDASSSYSSGLGANAGTSEAGYVATLIAMASGVVGSDAAMCAAAERCDVFGPRSMRAGAVPPVAVIDPPCLAARGATTPAVVVAVGGAVAGIVGGECHPLTRPPNTTTREDLGPSAPSGAFPPRLRSAFERER